MAMRAFAYSNKQAYSKCALTTGVWSQAFRFMDENKNRTVFFLKQKTKDSIRESTVIMDINKFS